MKSLVRVASSSKVKLDASRSAMATLGRHLSTFVHGFPVELQDRRDLQFNAQPEGREEIIRYTLAREAEMCRMHGTVSYLDIVVESGAIEGMDVAVVALFMPERQEHIILSQAIAFPKGSLDEARRRGFKTTTAGDVIHERMPSIPANDWQKYVTPFMSRQQQISDAIVRGLREMGW